MRAAHHAVHLHLAVIRLQVVDRVMDEFTIIGRDLFKKETDMVAAPSPPHPSALSAPPLAQPVFDITKSHAA